ncbi:MAG: hypothetical protein ACJAQT_004621, partial [Akkermansiaceae bacterium]
PTTMAWTIQQRHLSRAALPLIVPFEGLVDFGI